jgi:hypothetical protein
MLITISCLGQHGRFGNQLFQYAYARAYAEKLGAELHTPDWIGKELFLDINEPIMQKMGDVDLFGYFQDPEHLALLSKAKLKKWLRFKNPPQVQKHDLVFHKRRGDYLNHSDIYAIVSDESYTKAALKNGFNPEEAMIFDDSKNTEEYNETKLVHDFYSMMTCNTLFRANSTFSWWAATLGDCKVFSPKVEDKNGWVDVDFAEGNEEWNYRFNKYLIINP